MAKPRTTSAEAPAVPTVDGIDTLMATMGVVPADPARLAGFDPDVDASSPNRPSPLDPAHPSLKTQTKRIWGAVKKAERQAQQGEVQRTSIAMPLDLHTQIRIAAIQRRESFNDWVNEAIRQRLAREGS